MTASRVAALKTNAELFCHNIRNGFRELLSFQEMPRLGEMLVLRGHEDVFEVISIRHAVQAPSGGARPTIHIDVAARAARNDALRPPVASSTVSTQRRRSSL